MDVLLLRIMDTIDLGTYNQSYVYFKEVQHSKQCSTSTICEVYKWVTLSGAYNKESGVIL